jgi:enamine deaminase RidA (YjgF/YER057c/UK114 family)
VLNRVDALLLAAGSSKQQLISANIWLTDMAAFDEMNAVWDAWLAPGSAPARATVEARLAAPTFLVEIAVIAALSSPADEALGQ